MAKQAPKAADNDAARTGTAPDSAGRVETIEASLNAAPPVNGTNSSTATEQNYAALGLAVPTAGPPPPADAASASSAALIAPSAGATGAHADAPPTLPSPSVPAPQTTAPAATPPAASVGRTRSSTRVSAAKPSADESPTPAARPKRGKAAAKADDGPTPRDDAVQAGLDSTGDRLTADEAAISELKTALNSHQARSKVQHDVVTRQLTASNKEVAAVNIKFTILSREVQGLTKDIANARRGHENTRADIERLIDKARTTENMLSQLRSTAEGLGASAFAPDFMDSVDVTMGQMRAQLGEALDLVTNLRARVDALEADAAAARSEAADAHAMAARAFDEIRRLSQRMDRADSAADAHAGSAHVPDRPPRRSSSHRSTENLATSRPPPPPPPAAGSVRRRGSLSGSEAEDGRTFKAPRISEPRSERWQAPPDNYSRVPTFDGYHSYGTRESRESRSYAEHDDYDTDAPRAAETAPVDELEAIPAHWNSVRVGADPKKQIIHWGRRNEPHVAVKTFARWTSHLDDTGAIPIPTHAAAPPGMADNYRLVTFHTHADLIAFLRAWQNRPDELRDVVATPVAESAGPSSSTTAASLGLHPPGSNDNAGARRPSGSKDSHGRRHF